MTRTDSDPEYECMLIDVANNIKLDKKKIDDCQSYPSPENTYFQHTFKTVISFEKQKTSAF